MNTTPTTAAHEPESPHPTGPVPAGSDETITDLAALYDPTPSDARWGRAERNERSAAHAAAALKTYIGTENDEPQTHLEDLLTDLWHMADRLNLDMDAAWHQAESHHQHENPAQPV